MICRKITGPFPAMPLSRLSYYTDPVVFVCAPGGRFYYLTYRKGLLAREKNYVFPKSINIFLKTDIGPHSQSALAPSLEGKFPILTIELGHLFPAATRDCDLGRRWNFYLGVCLPADSAFTPYGHLVWGRMLPFQGLYQNNHLSNPHKQP